MRPENFMDSGMWIFPMIMMVIMLLVVFGIFGRRGGFRPPWSQGACRHHSRKPRLRNAFGDTKETIC